MTRENLYLRNRVHDHRRRRSIRPGHVSRFSVRVFDFLGEKVILCELRRERAIGFAIEIFRRMQEVGRDKVQD